jgi:hypothetical protein
VPFEKREKPENGIQKAESRAAAAAAAATAAQSPFSREQIVREPYNL